MTGGPSGMDDSVESPAADLDLPPVRSTPRYAVEPALGQLLRSWPDARRGVRTYLADRAAGGQADRRALIRALYGSGSGGLGEAVGVALDAPCDALDELAVIAEVWTGRLAGPDALARIAAGRERAQPPREIDDDLLLDLWAGDSWTAEVALAVLARLPDSQLTTAAVLNWLGAVVTTALNRQAAAQRSAHARLCEELTGKPLARKLPPAARARLELSAASNRDE